VFNSPAEGFPWDYLCEIFSGCQRMAKVGNAVEILPKFWTACVGPTNVTDDRRQTDGRQQIANAKTVLIVVSAFDKRKVICDLFPPLKIYDFNITRRAVCTELKRQEAAYHETEPIDMDHESACRVLLSRPHYHRHLLILSLLLLVVNLKADNRFAVPWRVKGCFPV